MQHFFRTLAVAACVLVAVSLAGCGGHDDGDGQPSPTLPGTTTTQTAQARITTPAPTATPTSRPAASPTTPGVVRCKTADLSLAVNPAGAAAGTHFVAIVLTNAGKGPCTISGYPGVSLVDANGNQVGEPADRNPAIDPEAIAIKPGGSAHALAGLPNYQNFPAGKCSGPAKRIKVYPPEETDALTVSFDDYACPGFSVRVFEPGAEGHS